MELKRIALAGLLAGTSGGCGDILGRDDDTARYMDCALYLTLSGAISETIELNGCGWENPRTMTFSTWTTRLRIELAFAEFDTSVAEPTGPIEVTVQVRQGVDGADDRTWETGPCQAEWLTNTQVEEEPGKLKNLITGTVDCGEPALPVEGDATEPVEVGEFSFEGYLFSSGEDP